MAKSHKFPFLEIPETAYIEYFSYRSAKVLPCDARIDRSELRDMCIRRHLPPLEEELASRCGVRPDNHIVYGVYMKDGGDLYIEFSDLYAYIGTQIRVNSRRYM